MAKSSPCNAVPLTLIAACMAMLVTTGLGQLTQRQPFTNIPGLFSPLPEVVKCWSSFTSVPSCLEEVYGSFLLGQIGRIGPHCCTVINEISDNCWPTMFPFNPFFPPLMKNFCTVSSTRPHAGGTIGASKISYRTPFPHVGTNATEIAECWSSIIHTEGCTAEIYKSLTSGQIITGIGPACCRVVTEIKDKCWPKMFPFNPFFPPLLNITCAKVIGATPPPKAI